MLIKFSGSIINITTSLTILLFLNKKITLERLEYVIIFTKFEFLLYLVTFTLYWFVHFFLEGGFEIYWNSYFCFLLPLISFVNYSFLRYAFNRKLRLKNRIFSMPQTIL